MLLLNTAYADIILEKLNVEKSFDYKELRSRYSTPSPVIEADFYPLGWSKDSKFAYIVVLANEALDFRRAIFRIQDMITDKVIFEKKYGDQNDKNALISTEFKKFLESKKSDVGHYLSKYHINGYDNKFHLFPIKYEKKLIDYNLKTIHEINHYFWHQQFLSRVTIDLYSNTVDGQKKIATKTIFDKKVDLKSLQYGAMVIGYLKSPFEERIAIVMIYFRRGWEGPPHTTNFELVGASLSKGF